METFIKKLAVYVLVCTASLAVIVSLYRERYFDGRVPVIKQQLLRTSKVQGDSIGLILGSSHTFFGINSTLLDGPWFNLASISQGFREDYAILLRAEENELPVSRIILPVSYFSNGYYLSESPLEGERKRCLDYSHAYGINYPFLGIPTWYAYYVGMIKDMFKRDKIHRFDSSGNLVESCAASDTMLNNAVQAYREHASSSDFSRCHPYLDSIITHCTRKNIQIYLLVMPFSRSYLQLMDSTSFNAFLAGIRARYAQYPVSILDERATFSTQNPDEYFRDADHLSSCGRDSFSVYLNSRIQKNPSLAESTD
jgi:hypothetical protein